MWATALVLGFAGSLHCVGMCSPLALAVTNITPTVFVNRILYNAGRIFVYACVGAIFSGAGSMLPLDGWQNILSIALGILLLIFGWAGVKSLRIPVVTSVILKFTGVLRGLFSRQLQNKTKASVVFLGALNGLLPCGLTFIAFTYAITLKGPLDGFNFMLLFGVGTLPAMLGFTSVMSFLIQKLHWNFQKVSTSLMMLSGILLIARVFIVAGHEAHVHGERLIDVVLCR